MVQTRSQFKVQWNNKILILPIIERFTEFDSLKYVFSDPNTPSFNIIFYLPSVVIDAMKTQRVVLKMPIVGQITEGAEASQLIATFVSSQKNKWQMTINDKNDVNVQATGFICI